VAKELCVRQRQYAFVTTNSEYNNLVTRNVLCCTILYGIDLQSGVAFLAHFDFPWTTKHISKIVMEAKEKAGGGQDLKFEIINGSLWVSIIFLGSAFFTRYFLRRKLAALGYFDSIIDHKFCLSRLRRTVRYNSSKREIDILAYYVHNGELDSSVSNSMTKANGSA